jgi:hypothetical protein
MPSGDVILASLSRLRHVTAGRLRGIPAGGQLQDGGCVVTALLVASVAWVAFWHRSWRAEAAKPDTFGGLACPRLLLIRS